jgi:hypothetical protein
MCAFEGGKGARLDPTAPSIRTIEPGPFQLNHNPQDVLLKRAAPRTVTTLWRLPFDDKIGFHPINWFPQLVTLTA